ncbi:cyanophycin synthetase [Tissierella sp. Yu-01]|uniref:cyanophycin synthetase n=1 Tax=Tissierella sp. Yu-01 TaxID=3035694 RepID=UPI00240D43F6|nr:cyanophycin synthetase [Tissierella sp. Yu-01]WFA09865.1 cyanophycin synthetase [Tissierella sp. Yu-01]
MNIINIKAYKGRNIYSHKPVLKFIVDLEDLNNKSTKDFYNFNEDLINIFPNIVEHHCGLGKHGGFVERINEGTYFGHVIEHLTLELQVMLGYDVYFGKTRALGNSSLYYIIIEFKNENVAIECVKQSMNIIDKIIFNEYVDLENILYDLNRTKDRYEFGLSTKSIYEEAKKRGIPVRRLGNESILELGYGKYSRKIQAALTDSTSGISIDISCNKQITKQLLNENNIPTPLGDMAHTIEDALDIAQYIGYPVVIKPLDGNQGKGVVLNVRNSQELEDNYHIPLKYSDCVIVEKCITGSDYRVLVINNKVSAVAERKPPEVIGDGIHTIEELVDLENKNELRGNGHEKPLTRIRLDTIAINYLYKNNLYEYYIPKAGERIRLRGNGNLSTGGSAIDCTGMIHPENEKLAIKAAKIIGLDIAGIDMIANDISKPLEECGGAVIEVNTAPGLRMHLNPTEGDGINVASDILDFLYPKGRPYSVPIFAITGTNGKTTTTRLISHTLSKSGKNVGMTTSSGIYINNECVKEGDNTGPLSTRNVLSSKDIDVAVLEVARGGIVRGGLGYDLADIGILTNIGEDHLGLDDIETIEDMAFVKSLVLEAVKPDGYSVINADDKMADYLLKRASGNIILFSINNTELFLNHINDGNIGINVENGTIYVYRNRKKIRLIELNQIPITFNGVLKCNIENVLAASSALFASGASLSTIREGLKSFKPDINMNPGRFNIFDLDNIKVMIDYGHNIDGYEQVGKFIKSLNVSRSIGVIGMPGDRPNNQIFEIGVKSSEYFSKIYIKEDRDLRDREPGEVANIIYNGLISADFNPSNIKIVLSETEALETAIRESRDGDFITMFYEELSPAVDVIKNYKDQKLIKKNTSYPTLSTNILTSVNYNKA